MPRIHPMALVEPGAELADDVLVGPFAYVGPEVRLGPGCVLHHHASIEGRTTIGRENVFFPNCLIGAAPQDLKYKGGDCRVTIGDRNLFRENATVHIGTEAGGGRTHVGSDGLFMAGAHIAHDCIIGDHVILSNNVLLAGHVEVQDWSILSGSVASHHFVRFGRHCFVGGLSAIVHDVPPFMIVEGRPGEVRGVNRNGLKRRGYDEQQLDTLKTAYRMLFHDSTPMSSQIVELERMYPTSAEIRELLDFLNATHAGKHGRFRESLRGNTAALNQPARDALARQKGES